MIPRAWHLFASLPLAAQAALLALAFIVPAGIWTLSVLTARAVLHVLGAAAAVAILGVALVGEPVTQRRRNHRAPHQVPPRPSPLTDAEAQAQERAERGLGWDDEPAAVARAAVPDVIAGFEALLASQPHGPGGAP